MSKEAWGTLGPRAYKHTSWLFVLGKAKKLMCWKFVGKATIYMNVLFLS